jgi:hypothetical protein
VLPLSRLLGGFDAGRYGSAAPTLVESQSQPITVAGEAAHRANLRPVVYVPHRNTVYVGQPAAHHVQLRNEFELPRHSGMFGYVRPEGIDWINSVGLPEVVEDMLRDRYHGNPWEELNPSWEV